MLNHTWDKVSDPEVLSQRSETGCLVRARERLEVIVGLGFSEGKDQRG